MTRVGRPIGLEAPAVGDQLDHRPDHGLRHEDLVRDLLLAVGRLAEGIQSLLTEEARSTRDGEGDDDAVAGDELAPFRRARAAIYEGAIAATEVSYSPMGTAPIRIAKKLISGLLLPVGSYETMKLQAKTESLLPHWKNYARRVIWKNMA